MALQTPNFDELRARYLEEVLNQDPQATTGADSDHYVRASGFAAAAEAIHQHVAWLSRQVFPGTAETEFLEQLANERGLARKPAAVATGSFTLTGTAGTPVSAGMQWQAPNGLLYELTENATIGGAGAVNVAAWATLAGTAGDLAAGVALTPVAPVPGIAAASVVSMAGGSEAETDDSLRDRLLELMRNAPAGGNAGDYKRWALEVAGVARAFVFGNRRELGTVDVVVMESDGLPSGGLLAQVNVYIAERRPVTADVLVMQPDLVSFNVTATVALSGVSLASAQAQAGAAIASYITSMLPGDTAYRSRLIAAIQDVPGVLNVVLVTPPADVASTVNAGTVQLLQLGTVVLST